MALYFGAIQHEVRVFQLQKKILRIMTGSYSRTSCKTLLQSLEIFTLHLQYILSSVKFLSYDLEIYMNLKNETKIQNCC
jgi:hypothetical protein